MIWKIRLFLFPQFSLREHCGKKVYGFLKKIVILLKYPRCIDEISYQKWVNQHTLSSNELGFQKKQVKYLNYRPLISIITPVYNPPLKILVETIDSVLNQTYPKWELCIANGSSNIKEISRILNIYSKNEPRIKVNYLEKNHGISGNSNIALDHAKGEFFLLLDHDDLISPNLLFEVVSLLNKRQNLDLIYLDEDKLSPVKNQIEDPWFKPHRWSPELLLSANYLMHSVFSRRIYKKVGAFDSQMDGAQDWDLMFRITENTTKIAHIPKVLYHWRKLPGSASGDFFAKPYVFEAQKKALESHLSRIGLNNPKTTKNTSPRHVNWSINGDKVAIIINASNNFEKINQSITNIYSNTSYKNYEVIIISDLNSCGDNISRFSVSEKDLKVRIIMCEEQINLPKKLNIGARSTKAECLLFFNIDLEPITCEWLKELIRFSQLNEVGAVGPKIITEKRRIYQAGLIINNTGVIKNIFRGFNKDEITPYGQINWYRNYSAISSDCMMIRRNLFNSIGGFNEECGSPFVEIECCQRLLQNGYRVVYNPFSQLLIRGEKIKYQEKFKNQFLKNDSDFIPIQDPYYNPNLSYRTNIPLLAKLEEYHDI